MLLASPLFFPSFMYKLSTLQIFLYRTGGVLLVMGALMPIVVLLCDAGGHYFRLSPYVYTLGAVMFGLVQLRQRCQNAGLVVRRLLRQQQLGAIVLILAGPLMFCSYYRVGFFDGAVWVMALAVGAVLDVYASFRIPAALAKEERA